MTVKNRTFLTAPGCFELGNRYETATGYEKYQMFRFNRGRLIQRRDCRMGDSAPVKSLGRHPRNDARCVEGERITNKRFSCIIKKFNLCPVLVLVVALTRCAICGYFNVQEFQSLYHSIPDNPLNPPFLRGTWEIPLNKGGEGVVQRHLPCI